MEEKDLNPNIWNEASKARVETDVSDGQWSSIQKPVWALRNL